MFEMFKKKKPVGSDLIFKSSEAFFAYQCKFGPTNLEKGVPIIAVVQDPEGSFGDGAAVLFNKDGSQLAMLRIASGDGGFPVFSNTPSAKGDRLQVGDIVLWFPFEYSKEAGELMPDSRSGWVGLIRAKLRPMILRNGSLSIVCKYE